METARGVDEALALIEDMLCKAPGDVTGDVVDSAMKLRQARRESRSQLKGAITKVNEIADPMSTSALVQCLTWYKSPSHKGFKILPFISGSEKWVEENFLRC